MKNKNIVLIGFMGVGKTLVSRILGQKLKMRVISTDAWIEEKQKKTVKQIFEAQGEVAFRKMEETAVGEITQETGIIIDCGGGIAINPVNIKRLKHNGILVYLEAQAETILKNIKNQNNRPLLATDNPKAKIEELMEKRQEFYKQADYCVNADHSTVEKIAEKVLKVIAHE